MTIHARFLPKYPKRISVTDGLTKNEANGVVTLGFDYVNSEFGVELQQAVDSTAAHDASAATHDTASAASATAASGSAASALQSAITAAGGTYDTVAVAAAITPAVAPSALRVNGYSTAGDGGAALYAKVASEPSHAGKFSITLLDGTTIVWFELAEKAPRPQMFGAKGDGTTDDKTAIQNTVNYCLSFTRPRPMMLTALHFVSASIIINRQIGTAAAASDFRIIGLGDGAGFTANAITVIDSDLTTTDTPVSCNLNFQNVLFIGGGSADTLAVSWKYVRVNFDGCRFNIIRCVQSPLYLQSWRWHHCSALSWTGLFISCLVTYYDCHWDNNTFESGGDGIKSFNGGFDGSSLTQNLFENSGQFFFQNTGLGTTIIGNYTEGNSKQDYVLSDPSNGGFHRGTVFQGNYAGLNTHGLYNVVVGDAQGMIAGGNYNDDKMYDTTFTAANGFKSIGDYATNSKFSTANNGWELDHVGKFTTGSGSYASLTSTVPVDLWSATLDPGDYDIEGLFTFEGNSATTATILSGSLSTTSGALDYSTFSAVPASGTIFSSGGVFTVAVRGRFNLSATTTIYAVGSAVFAVNTCSAKATVTSRRAA